MQRLAEEERVKAREVLLRQQLLDRSVGLAAAVLPAPVEIRANLGAGIAMADPSAKSCGAGMSCVPVQSSSGAIGRNDGLIMSVGPIARNSFQGFLSLATKERKRGRGVDDAAGANRAAAVAGSADCPVFSRGPVVGAGVVASSNSASSAPQLFGVLRAATAKGVGMSSSGHGGAGTPSPHPKSSLQSFLSSLKR